MNNRKKKIVIILIAAVVCMTAIISFLYATDLRYRIAAKTGLLYPSAREIEISDAEEMWNVSFPEGAYIEAQNNIRCVSSGSWSYTDAMTVKYKPYSYGVRVVIPLDKTEDFLESVRSLYNDETYDEFGNKYELGYFPEIISDMEGKELSYSFSHIEDCPPNGEAIICIHRSIYIFEEDNTAVIHLSM